METTIIVVAGGQAATEVIKQDAGFHAPLCFLSIGHGRDGLNECGGKTEPDNVSSLRAKLAGFGHFSFSMYDAKRNIEFPWQVVSPQRGFSFMLSQLFFHYASLGSTHAIDITYDMKKAINYHRKEKNL